MFIQGRKKLKVAEIDSPSVIGRGGLITTNAEFCELNFSYWKLCYAIAKTTISRDVSDLNLIVDSLANLFRFAFLIDGSRHTLTLIKTNFSNLRDFTRTNRTGEIAQGLTYLIAQEHLNFPFVVDFNGFINLNGGTIPHKTSTPDFILQSTSMDYNVSLIESKGSYPENVHQLKPSLKKALRQCNSGEAVLTGFDNRYNVHRKFGFHVKFENETTHRESGAYIADPETGLQKSERNLHVVRSHYASWFSLMGDLENAARLITNNPPVLQYDRNDKYYYYDRLQAFPPFLFFGFPGEMRIGIPNEIIALLMGETSKVVEYELIDTENLIQFRDGIRLTRTIF